MSATKLPVRTMSPTCYLPRCAEKWKGLEMIVEFRTMLIELLSKWIANWMLFIPPTTPGGPEHELGHLSRTSGS